MIKKLLFSSFLFFVSFAFAPSVSAQVVINEFSPAAGSSSDTDYPDWVEVYFNGEDKSLYQLRDTAGNAKNLSEASCGVNICTVDWSNKLDNGGDTIKLVLISSPDPPVDQITYGGEGNVCVPGHGQSIGRISTIDSPYAPTNVWERFSTPSKNLTNNNGLISPCPSPTPEPTATLTPTPKPTNTSTPTPTPKPSSTPMPTPKPTITKTPTPKITDSTPSKTEETSNLFANNSKNTSKDENGVVLGEKDIKNGKIPYQAVILILIGVLMLIVSFLKLIKRKGT